MNLGLVQFKQEDERPDGRSNMRPSRVIKDSIYSAIFTSFMFTFICLQLILSTQIPVPSHSEYNRLSCRWQPSQSSRAFSANSSAFVCAQTAVTCLSVYELSYNRRAK